MTKATSTTGQVPTPNAPNGSYVNEGASSVKDLTHDHDFGPPFHALVMCVAFVLVFPFGAFVMRVMERVMWHAWIQGAAMVLVILGFGSAIYISLEFNKVSPARTINQASTNAENTVEELPLRPSGSRDHPSPLSLHAIIAGNPPSPKV